MRTFLKHVIIINLVLLYGCANNVSNTPDDDLLQQDDIFALGNEGDNQEADSTEQVDDDANDANAQNIEPEQEPQPEVEQDNQEANTDNAEEDTGTDDVLDGYDNNTEESEEVSDNDSDKAGMFSSFLSLFQLSDTEADGSDDSNMAEETYPKDTRQPYLVIDIPNFSSNDNKQIKEEVTEEDLLEKKAYSLIDSKVIPPRLNVKNYNKLDEEALNEIGAFISSFLRSQEFNAVVIAIPYNPSVHGINKEDGNLSNYYRYLLYTHYVKKYLYKTASMTMRVFLVNADIPADKLFITMTKYDSTLDNFKYMGENFYTSPTISVEDWLEQLEGLEKYQEQEEQQNLEGEQKSSDSPALEDEKDPLATNNIIEDTKQTQNAS